nr:BCCT family transporter [Rhodopirellula sp. SM50]
MSHTTTSQRPTPPRAEQMPRVVIGPHFEMHPVVFLTSAAIVLAVALLCFVWPANELQDAFVAVRKAIAVNFGWLYVASMAFFFGFAFWLALGKYGQVRLGRDDELPEFSRGSWFAMLFSAGMGIGLLFFGVAEPIIHYESTPPGFADGLDQSRLSMAVTIFHWGLHPWALYCVVGLALAYSGFRRGLPLSFRSLLYPVFGDRIWGRLGDLIDILAIVSTLTGVATSLGIGAQQVNAGLSHLFGIGAGIGVQMALIAGITAMATASVVVGLHGGIRRLSELNLVLAATLMVLVVLGVGVFTYLGAAIENTGAYLQTLPFNSLRTGAFNEPSQTWVNGWTVFYWAWWISWSPFVGMFIARISRGRTIKEFVIGVLLVPTAVGIAWLTAFGTTTLRQYTDHVERLSSDPDYDPGRELPKYWVGEVGPTGELARLASGEFKRAQQPLTAVEYYQAAVVTPDGRSKVDTLPTVLFVMLEGLFPSVVIQTVAIGIATLCIVLFFVTSSDSASMVIDIIASGGSRNPPVGTRLFWAISEGLVAAALLYGGGLDALQAASIAAALPLTFVLLLACYGLVTSLHRDSQISSSPLSS